MRDLIENDPWHRRVIGDHPKIEQWRTRIATYRMLRGEQSRQIIAHMATLAGEEPHHGNRQRSPLTQCVRHQGRFFKKCSAYLGELPCRPQRLDVTMQGHGAPRRTCRAMADQQHCEARGVGTATAQHSCRRQSRHVAMHTNRCVVAQLVTAPVPQRSRYRFAHEPALFHKERHDMHHMRYQGRQCLGHRRLAVQQPHRHAGEPPLRAQRVGVDVQQAPGIGEARCTMRDQQQRVIGPG